MEEILKLATSRLPQLLAVLPINAPVSRLYRKVFIDWLTDMLGGFSYGFISSIAVTIFGSLATIPSHLLQEWFTKRTHPPAVPQTHRVSQIRNTLHSKVTCRASVRASGFAFLFPFLRWFETLDNSNSQVTPIRRLRRQQFFLRRHQVD